ncbi:MAG: hypothetical protein U0271_01090 [Polyangiaceae bacterium]
MKRELAWGASVIERLLPHRRPFLMVDTVDAYERGPKPALWASRYITANEHVFEGHFPHVALWPGVYTIEGLGQATNVLALIDLIETGMTARGLDPERLLAGLGNLELGARMQPGYRPEVAADLEQILGIAVPDPASRLGMTAHVDVKLLAPVFAGQRLDYFVRRTHMIDALLRFEVVASVKGREVARGVMKSAAQGLERVRGDAEGAG